MPYFAARFHLVLSIYLCVGFGGFGVQVGFFFFPRVKWIMQITLLLTDKKNYVALGLIFYCSTCLPAVSGVFWSTFISVCFSLTAEFNWLQYFIKTYLDIITQITKYKTTVSSNYASVLWRKWLIYFRVRKRFACYCRHR